MVVKMKQSIYNLAKMLYICTFKIIKKLYINKINTICS